MLLSGGERRGNSVRFCRDDGQLGFRVKADVYKGRSCCYWLLDGGRIRTMLLVSLLLGKATLCLLSQLVFFLLLFLLQSKVTFNTVDLQDRVCVVSSASRSTAGVPDFYLDRRV